MYGKRDPFMQTVIANQISADSGPVSHGTSSFSRDIWTPMLDMCMHAAQTLKTTCNQTNPANHLYPPLTLLNLCYRVHTFQNNYKGRGVQICCDKPPLNSSASALLGDCMCTE